jgi:DNA-binding response OmpR family regulator
LRILVADDDHMMSELICAVVRKAGHMPIAAFDGTQTLMLAKRTPSPDLVILDINMPGGSGLETMNELKRSAKTSQIPVIVVSGSTDEDIDAQVTALGAVAYLGKPVAPEALTVAVRRALGQPDA